MTFCNSAAAVRQFWGTPELVEKLLPYLDLTSTKHLAEAQKLVRKILRKAFTWNKLIQRILPKDERPFEPRVTRLSLQCERQKARILAEILTLMKGGSLAELTLALLHAICERNPMKESQEEIHVSCSCLQTHSVSPCGFMFLLEVEASLGPLAESMLVVDTVTAKGLMGPLLMALASKVARQQVPVKKLNVLNFTCNSKESAEAINNLVEKSEAAEVEEGACMWIRIAGTLEPGTFARAYQHVSQNFGLQLYSIRIL